MHSHESLSQLRYGREGVDIGECVHASSQTGLLKQQTGGPWLAERLRARHSGLIVAGGSPRRGTFFKIIYISFSPPATVSLSRPASIPYEMAPPLGYVSTREDAGMLIFFSFFFFCVFRVLTSASRPFGVPLLRHRAVGPVLAPARRHRLPCFTRSYGAHKAAWSCCSSRHSSVGMSVPLLHRLVNLLTKTSHCNRSAVCATMLTLLAPPSTNSQLIPSSQSRLLLYHCLQPYRILQS